MCKTGPLFIVILVMIFISVAGAVPKGNADKGRTYFRQNCKACHTQRGKGGEITPLSKTTEQWRTFFDKGKHAQGTLLQMAAEQDLLNVKAFLIAHAADSEHPETCGR